jgi:transcriptional/translational regulatory protein YebC/TACO1
VQQALENAKIKYSSAESIMEAVNSVELSGKEAQQVIRLLELLEDNDDVQNVYSNFETEDEDEG